MTKFIPVAFALVAFGASLSPALAEGDRVSHDASLVNTYAPVATQASAPIVGTYHYTDAESFVIDQSARQR